MAPAPSPVAGRSTIAVDGASCIRPLIARRARSSVATCSTVPRLKRKATSAASLHWPIAAAPIMASVMRTFMSTWRARRLKTAARATKRPPLTTAAPKSHGAAAGAAAVATKPAAVNAPETMVAMARGSASQNPRPARAAPACASGFASLARRSTVSYPRRRTARKTSGMPACVGSRSTARVAAPKLTSALRTPRSLRSAPWSLTAQSAQSMPVTCRTRRLPASSPGSGRERSSGPCSWAASGQWSSQCAWAPARRAKVSTASPASASSSKRTLTRPRGTSVSTAWMPSRRSSSRPISSTHPPHSAARGSSSDSSRLRSVMPIRLPRWLQRRRPRLPRTGSQVRARRARA